MKVKDLLDQYHRLVVAADICRFKECTPEQALAIIRFLDERSKVVDTTYNEKQRRIISSAAFDYAFGMKNLDDEADLFKCED
jgi:hypothetical protein